MNDDYQQYSDPKISIVMPLYNKEADVQNTVESVLCQTITDFELIVVNDGSTDNSPELVRSINDKRIRVVNQENQGVSAARNTGIGLARTDFIAFIDSDDLWEPTFLESILRLHQMFPSCSVFATGYAYLNVDGSVSYPTIHGLPQDSWKGMLENYFAVAVLSDPPITSSTVTVAKQAIQAIGGFPHGVKSGEDLLTWAKLAVTCKIAYDTRSLAIFRQSALRAGRPSRIPENPDRVGSALRKLKGTVSPDQRTAFRHYIALWHKNRASMYLRMNMRRQAVNEVLQMGCNRLDRKFVMYVACLTVPFFVTRKLFLLWERGNFTRNHYENRYHPY
jgi:glycosyltransferase involved in cell wall biosynthesis